MPKVRRRVLIAVLGITHLVVLAWMVDRYDIIGDAKPKMVPALEKLLRTMPSSNLSRQNMTQFRTTILKSADDVKDKGNGHLSMEKAKIASSEKLTDVNQQDKGLKPEGQGPSSGKQDCGDFQKLAAEPRDETFQPIAGTNSFIYSAFAVSPQVMRSVFVYDNNHSANEFHCHFKYTSNDVISKVSTSLPVSEIVDGTVTKIQDGHQRPYTAAFLACPMSIGASMARDLTLSVTHGTCHERPSNLLPVQRSPAQSSWEFTVCVAPFHHNYEQADDLVEMIELNRILGANHFYFYNASCSHKVVKVLDYYKKNGLATVIQWHLPRDPNSKDKPIDIHYIGQNAAINDCLYRNRKRSQYVVVTDVDEFIIPHNPNFTTWSEFVKSRDQKKTNFQVKSSFYRKEWVYPNNTFEFLKKAKEFHSIPLQNIQRHKEIFKHNVRSKYIANPLQVVEGGIHYVHKSSKQTDYVPESEALVHHYRRQGNPNKPSLRIFDDIVVKKYGKQLVSALENARTGIGLT